MNNIFPYPIKKRDYHSEIIEAEITDWRSKHRLPRHISAVESKPHRGGHNLSRINYLPKVCQINTNGQTKANPALDILKYQLSDRISQQKHLENLRYNLQHRLQVAKAQGNNHLVNILQDEYKQLNYI